MSARVDDLEPSTREMCRRWLDACADAGLAVKVTHTLRTLDEQGHLYAQGRTVPGKIVTKAKPGQSPHNWGCAFDFAFQGPTPYPPVDSLVWEQAGALGEALGLAWGGRWKSFKDRPHLERPDWKAVRAARGGQA